MLQSPDVQSYAFGYNGTGTGVVPGDLVAYRDHRTGPYTSPGQTGVFWDTVTRSDGRKVGVCSSSRNALMGRCKGQLLPTGMLIINALVVLR
jgi:hypothetical protein